MENKTTEKKAEAKTNSKEIAVIRIRKSTKMITPIKDTLNMMNLKKINHCILLKSTPTNLGMIKKCKDYITWGEIDSETKKLLFKRKDKTNNNKILFRLHPPRGGFERKGIKKTFNLGGVLGYRKNKIDVLIKKML